MHVILFCLTIFIATGGFIYHLHVRFEGVKLGYETSRQKKIQTRLLLEKKELMLELASLKEQKRIEEEARKKLGMEIPGFERIVPVTKKRRVVSVSGGAL
jgi:cell division protein FtsL